jgi:hypothetical protein
MRARSFRRSGLKELTLNKRTLMQSEKNVDAKVIVEPLDSLLTALENKLEREWPPSQTTLGARELFLLTLRTAATTYRSVRYLSAETPPDPYRRLEYCISIPPLNRTILDNLFTVIFILEDLPTRCRWYFKADWRETRLELERYAKEYVHLPDWQDWLKRFREYSDTGIAIVGASPNQVAAPSSIDRWPNPGGMVNYGISSKSPLPPTRAFLKYLNDWFYADLSQQSHLGGSGLPKRAGGLINDYRKNPQTEESLKKYSKSQVGQTITLILSLASELEAYFNFGLRERAQYLWGVVTPYIVVGKEVFEKRYASLLGMSSEVIIL